jgi:ubiquinone biosynthesis protein COQ4
LTVNDVTVNNVPMIAATNPDTRPHNPIHWGQAFKALVTLARDTSRTDQVFTIISALTGDSFERTYQAFKKTEHGQKLLRERPILNELLTSRDRLRAMPAGSLGRAYLTFMEEGELTADGLVEAQTTGKDPNEALELDADRRYVADRVRDQHDLWHVLTDYGCDDTGEIANLWFSVGQFGNPGMAFIAFFGTIDGQMDPRFSWPRYCARAYLRGRRAARLVSEPVEDMLELPIDVVRRRLGIALTPELHPEGIRRGYRKDRELGAAAA